MSQELIIAELHQAGECIARWTDVNGPADLAEQLPRLRAAGWAVHDFRDVNAGPVRPSGSEGKTR